MSVADTLTHDPKSSIYGPGPWPLKDDYTVCLEYSGTGTCNHVLSTSLPQISSFLRPFRFMPLLHPALPLGIAPSSPYIPSFVSFPSSLLISQNTPMATSDNYSETLVGMRKDNTGTHVEVEDAKGQGSAYPADYEKHEFQTRGDDKGHDVEPRVSFA